MAQYESSYIVNSFHAVNAATHKVITPDTEGYITVTAGTKIVFESMDQSGYGSVNTLVFFTKDQPLKVQLNDNALYPFYVAKETKRGLKSMRIDSITILSNCTFYFEGMVN